MERVYQINEHATQSVATFIGQIMTLYSARVLAAGRDNRVVTS